MHEQFDQQKPHTLPCFLKLKLEHWPPTETSANVVSHELEILHE